MNIRNFPTVDEVDSVQATSNRSARRFRYRHFGPSKTSKFPTLPSTLLRIETNHTSFSRKATVEDKREERANRKPRQDACNDC